MKLETALKMYEEIKTLDPDIILSGSASLVLLGIINRDIKDLDIISPSPPPKSFTIEENTGKDPMAYRIGEKHWIIKYGGMGQGCWIQSDEVRLKAIGPVAVAHPMNTLVGKAIVMAGSWVNKSSGVREGIMNKHAHDILAILRWNRGR